MTAVVRGRVTSELRRWQENALKVVATIDGVYLRASQRSNTPATLLGQRAGIGEVLSGRVEQYRLRAGALERVEDSALPRDVGIFGLALAPPGSPVLLYSLDRDGYISGLTASGEVAWGSERPYGGYPPPLSAIDLFGPGSAFQDENFDEKTRAFQGRLLAEESPAGVRLLVPRNFGDSPVMLARQRAHGQGEVVILEGAPESLEEFRRSRAFDGYVADLARADIDGDGSPEILFVVNSIAGVLRGERGKLVAWRQPDASGKAK